MKSRGELAVDADWEGYNHWVDLASGRTVIDLPDPVPLERFAWRISRTNVESLAARARQTVAFLFGSVENEVDVWDLFDLVVCLVSDNETLRARLHSRTTNPFGKQPDELAAVLGWNETVESIYRRSGATIVDGRQPVSEVAAAILAAAKKIAQ